MGLLNYSRQQREAPLLQVGSPSVVTGASFYVCAMGKMNSLKKKRVEISSLTSRSSRRLSPDEALALWALLKYPHRPQPLETCPFFSRFRSGTDFLSHQLWAAVHEEPLYDGDQLIPCTWWHLKGFSLCSMPDWQKKKKPKTQHKPNQHHLQLLRILRLDNYLAQSRIRHNRNNKVRQMGSPQERVVGNSAGGKEDRDWNAMSTSFFSQWFP